MESSCWYWYPSWSRFNFSYIFAIQFRIFFTIIIMGYSYFNWGLVGWIFYIPFFAFIKTKIFCSRHRWNLLYVVRWNNMVPNKSKFSCRNDDSPHSIFIRKNYSKQGSEIYYCSKYLIFTYHISRTS